MSRFGIAINNDSVVRTVFHKYLHPKEVFIANGVLNQGLADAINRVGKKDATGKYVFAVCTLCFPQAASDAYVRGNVCVRE